jgi:hypothetical protein
MPAPIVDQSLISGLRVSIGAPEKIENLEWALKILAAGMEDSAEHHPSII